MYRGAIVSIETERVAMVADDRAVLVNELKELVMVRLAVVLMPAMRALRVRNRGDLADFLQRYVGTVAMDLEHIIANYDVRKCDEHRNSQHV